MKAPREISAKSILCKSNLAVSGYSANPYVGCQHACKYCYASFMKKFTRHSEPWGEFLDVKNWPEIKNPEKYEGKEIFISSVTDPYQPAEEKYRRTRKLLEQLRGSGCKLSIATKSDLILRDMDLLKEFPNARIAWSINTLDDKFQRQMDKAPSIERRLEAMKKFHAEGFHATCFIAPIFPGLSRPAEIIEAAKEHCDMVWLDKLNLRGPCKFQIMNFIKNNYPRLYDLYSGIYFRGDNSWWRSLHESLLAYAGKAGLPYVCGENPGEGGLEKFPVIVNYFFRHEMKPREAS